MKNIFLIFLKVPLVLDFVVDTSYSMKRERVETAENPLALELDYFSTELPDELIVGITLDLDANLEDRLAFSLVCKRFLELSMRPEKEFPNKMIMGLDGWWTNYPKVSNGWLFLYSNLTTLDLNQNDVVTDSGIRHLTNLIKLNLEWDYGKITDNGIKPLTTIKDLGLEGNKTITYKGLKCLTNLTSLNLGENENITGVDIKHLTNLTSLNLENNQKVTGVDIKYLPNLTHLNLSCNSMIDINDINHLTNLVSLVLRYNKKITNHGIKQLTNLRFLDLNRNDTITDDGIKKLSTLTHLNLGLNDKITDGGIRYLTNLIYLWRNRNITKESTKHLRKLI